VTAPKPKHLHKLGGRPKGGANKATREIRSLAQQYGPEVIEFFMTVVRNEGAPLDYRMVAGKELLDRGYGKSAPPPQRKLGGPGSYDFSRLTPDQVRQGYEIARLMAPDSVGDAD
jgi:hypothetical protein